MKIVNRKTFLELPSGTIYSEHYSGDGFNNLSIKYETWGNDWIYMDINDFDDCENSGERYEKIDKMRDEGAEYPLNLDTTSRDGLFEDEQMFAIYDENDVNKIIEVLTQAVTKMKR